MTCGTRLTPAHLEEFMKIGIIASVAHRLPPVDYGPWEQIASTLTEGFVQRGHDVTLFATADSTTAAKLRGTVPRGYEEDEEADAKVSEALHIAAAFERSGDFDIMANHFDFMPLSYSRLVTTPLVTTIHGISSKTILPVYRRYNDIAHYVAISDADRQAGLTYDATIHHGIDTDRFTYVAGSGKYLLFLGRIHPDKGTDIAIEVARRAGLPLIIAGVVHDRAYFEERVEPHLDGAAVSYLGAVGPARRDVLLGGAAALLHLISFAEPFGLSVIEALATGTPVIATSLGSMPEILREGVTGYLVHDVAGAVAAVARLGSLDRAACRSEAVDRFGARRMVDEYLALFERILQTHDPRRPWSHQSIGSPGLFSHAGR
jgi:glycosyltransferase involved in cell wall biosynthesis